ncbi:hypothetical protein BDZ97DRAFT_1799287, partial [Flammula alnicola]
MGWFGIKMLCLDICTLHPKQIHDISLAFFLPLPAISSILDDILMHSATPSLRLHLPFDFLVIM